MQDPAAVLTRRRLIQIAGNGYLGLNLGGLWQAHAAGPNPTATATPIRACILIFYYGGPSHIDTYDLKPNAPAEVRGEFKPIATTVPGMRVCEHLPKMSRLMHKVALVRSVTHAARLHDSASIHALTGRPLDGTDRELFNPLPQFYPSHGSAVSYLRRDRNPDVPFASVPFAFHNVVEVPCQGGGFLGSAFDPLRIDMNPEARRYQAEMFERPGDVDAIRLGSRQQLLQRLGQAQAIDGKMRGLYEKACRLLDSEAIRQAADITREPLAIRDRYGFGALPSTSGGNGAELGHARHMRGQNLLLARRLVEAGVPFVNVYDFKQQGQNWDAHSKGASQHKNYLLPQADQSLSALIEDLDARGLLDSTLVVAMGEFGRTPKINGDGGRDHWPDCYTVLMAGGGVHGGAVHGASDRIGAYPAVDPVTPGDLAATIFWRFGIDPATEIHDQTGRPHRVATGEPLRRLFGA
ncbi:DUF1501 domain-containing protein [Zavarzinella formosa]|uniref:DUF1501 domain-containing protein n=1 Tax=Zavarzinella formosa TaxID=360055 RepID=UPI0003136D84|nr:DUF1501 domain-containing protein [Zavarzinella formosa]